MVVYIRLEDLGLEARCERHACGVLANDGRGMIWKSIFSPDDQKRTENRVTNVLELAADQENVEVTYCRTSIDICIDSGI